MNFIPITFINFLVVYTTGSSLFHENVEENLHDDKLIYLGYWKHTDQTRSSGGGPESHYFLSVNSAEWEAGMRDCETYLGKNSTLANVETLDEQNAIDSFLHSHSGSTSSFWLGARFNVDSSQFLWTRYALPLGKFVKWLDGHPGHNQVATSRLFGRSVERMSVGSQGMTIPTRFLCEVELFDNSIARPCGLPLDVVIAIDASGSLGSKNFAIALEFVRRFIVATFLNPQTRTAVFVYSSKVKTIYGLQEDLTESEKENRIRNSQYLNQGTASDLALTAVLNEFRTHNRSDAQAQQLLFLTDGGSDAPAKTQAAATLLKDAGVQCFALGIGSNLKMEELQTIAGGIRDNVFVAPKFADLMKMEHHVSDRMCNNGDGK